MGLCSFCLTALLKTNTNCSLLTTPSMLRGSCNHDEPSMCIVTLKTGAYEDLIAHIHNCCAFSLTINKLNFHMIMEGERLLKQDK